MRLHLAVALIALSAIPAVAQEGGAQAGGPPAWRKLRPDAPEEPKGEPYKYKTPMPEGFKLPTLEELEKLQWKDGPVKDSFEIGRERSSKIKPLVSVEEALKLKNDSEENNAKILSALCQYPKSDDEVDWDATFNRHSAAPNALNPLLANSKYEQWMVSMIAIGLFDFDHQLQPFCSTDTVKRWRRTDVVDLMDMRDDVTWDDGTPFTAYDIEFSYHVIMDERIPIPAVRQGTDELAWVKAYGPHTIAFFHRQAKVTNVWNAGFPTIPKHIYERSLVSDPSMKSSEWHAYWNRNPLSGGPYRLREFTTGQQVVFERREGYYTHGGKAVRRKPYFKAIRFRLIDEPNAALLALKKGELDEYMLLAPQWAGQTNDDDFYKHTTKIRGTEWSYTCVMWNLQKPWFKDKRVRLALAHAFDDKEFHEKIYFGLGQHAVGPFHPAAPWGTPDSKPIKQDLDKAEKLLDEAGWTDSDNDGVRDREGVKFEFTISVPTGGIGEKVAVLLKQNLQDVGIAMNIKMLEWATYSDLTENHNFEAGTQGWGTGTDPDMAENVWASKAFKDGRNYGGYSNARVDELFIKGKIEFDLEKRRKIYQEINRLIFEDQPYIFITYRPLLWSFNKEMRGYNTSPREVFGYGPGWASMWKPKKK